MLSTGSFVILKMLIKYIISIWIFRYNIACSKSLKHYSLTAIFSLSAWVKSKLSLNEFRCFICQIKIGNTLILNSLVLGYQLWELGQRVVDRQRHDADHADRCERVDALPSQKEVRFPHKSLRLKEVV